MQESPCHESNRKTLIQILIFRIQNAKVLLHHSCLSNIHNINYFEKTFYYPLVHRKGTLKQQYSTLKTLIQLDLVNNIEVLLSNLLKAVSDFRTTKLAKAIVLIFIWQLRTRWACVKIRSFLRKKIRLLKSKKKQTNLPISQYTCAPTSELSYDLSAMDRAINP